MKRTVLAVFVVLTVSLGTPPARGDIPTNDPVITDAAGDANWIYFSGSTSPASVDEADLLNIWFDTPFEKVRTRDPGTDIVTVDFRATAFRISIETAGPHPIVGPTLVYMVPAIIGGPDGCPALFEMWIRRPTDTNPAQGADIRSAAGAGRCPERFGVFGIGHPDFTLITETNPDGRHVAHMTYPFTAFDGVGDPDELVGFLAEGVELHPSGGARVDSMVCPMVAPGFCLRVSPTAYPIDETDALVAPFTIGQDLPRDFTVDCSREPAHPECQQP